MRNAMIYSIFLCSLLIMSHVTAATLPSPNAAKELSDKIMERVAAGDLEGGLRLMKPYGIVPEAEMETAIGQAKLQAPMYIQRFGKIIGREFLREEKVGESLIRFTHLQKFDRHVMRWVFVFYKGNAGWVLNTFYFDDNIRAVFSGQN